MLHVEDLWVRYGPIVAVRGVSVSVGKRDFVAVLGPNGAGKTSLVKGILGVEGHRSERLELDGADLRRDRSTRRVDKGITLVPEGREIFPAMTAEDNLRAGFDAKRVHSREYDELQDQVFTLFPKLRDRRTQNAGTMSGGEQQMLAIGRALVQEPRVLILDEPSLGLAPVIVDQVMDALVELNKGGLPILMIEQDAARAIEVSQHVMVMRGGRIIFDDSTAGVGFQEMQELIMTGVQRASPE